MNFNASVCGIPAMFKNTPDRSLISSSLIFRNGFQADDFKALSIAHIAEHCAIVQYIRRHIKDHPCTHVIEYFSGRTSYDYTAFSINSLRKGYPYVPDIFSSILETRRVEEDIFNEEVKNVLLEYPPVTLDSFSSKCRRFDAFINDLEFEPEAEKIIREINISEVEKYLKDYYVETNSLVTFLGDVKEAELMDSGRLKLDFKPATAHGNKREDVKMHESKAAASKGDRILGAGTACDGKCELWFGFKTGPAAGIKEFFTQDICFLLIASIFKNSYNSLLRSDSRYRNIEFQNIGCSYRQNANYVVFRYAFGSEMLLADAAAMLESALRDRDSHRENIAKIKQEYMDSVLMKLDELKYANQFLARMNFLFDSYRVDFEYYEEIMESIAPEDIWAETVEILKWNYIYSFSRNTTVDMLPLYFPKKVLNCI
ncbi:hypothetical protein CLHUN_10460 [Ruminiclostridium hungatei]|uniref:Peptidase M16 inactive domain protein n=1 Tax=Ruminiclostridium hungatei TaxID=48256 RepID=A0A1V4SMP5_RUMHU|nr:insulinase family protein [Ruminiclostridium hungatei]OPX45159.1 hypothetical protein CLHUN_10460 [Ruminiclostridium hungatei]